MEVNMYPKRCFFFFEGEGKTIIRLGLGRSFKSLQSLFSSAFRPFRAPPNVMLHEHERFQTEKG